MTVTRRTVVVGTAVVVGLTALTASRLQHTSIDTSGYVRITTAPDGLSALVSLANPGMDEPGALIDHAFVVQVATPVELSFEGIATSAFTAPRLIVTVSPQVEWVFSVVGVDSNPFTATPDGFVVPAVGLSHYWDLPLGTTHESLETELFARLCARGEGGEDNPACEDCDEGGPGAESCEVSCGGGACSATCGDGAYACCNCPESCGCCPDSIQLGAQSLVSSTDR